MAVSFQWLGGPLGYFTDGTLKKEFFPEDSFEERVFNGLNHPKGSLPSVKGFSIIQVHVSGSKSNKLWTVCGDHDRIFNISREKTRDVAGLTHHLEKVESLGRNLFFTLRRSGFDLVTVGFISSRNGDGPPVIVIPNDQVQVAVREALFGDAETWIPEMIPFLGQLITSAHPLLLKAHNETGFMPRFTEITGAPNFKSGLFYLREKILNKDYENKEKFYLATYQFFRAMKRYCEEMEKEAGAYLATPLPKSVW